MTKRRKTRNQIYELLFAVELKEDGSVVDGHLTGISLFMIPRSC